MAEIESKPIVELEDEYLLRRILDKVEKKEGKDHPLCRKIIKRIQYLGEHS